LRQNTSKTKPGQRMPAGLYLERLVAER
jgi:hypothetical protein